MSRCQSLFTDSQKFELYGSLCSDFKMFSCRHHFEISLKLSKIFSRVTFTNVETRSRNAVTSPCNTSASCFTNCGFKNPPYLLNTTHIFTLFYLHNTCKSLNVHSTSCKCFWRLNFCLRSAPIKSPRKLHREDREKWSKAPEALTDTFDTIAVNLLPFEFSPFVTTQRPARLVIGPAAPWRREFGWMFGVS